MEKHYKECIHITQQVLPPEPPDDLTDRATRAASVKASFTPRFRFAEHSTASQRASWLGLDGKNTYLDILMLECALRLLSPVCNRSFPCLSSVESNCRDRALLLHRASPANRTSVPQELISRLDSFPLSPLPISIRYFRASLWNQPRIFR